MEDRPIAILPAKLERNLAAYARAASSAGLGILAMVQPAAAKIVYTPTDVVLKVGDSYHLDLNSDGITDFVLQNRYSRHSTSRWWSLRAQAGKNGVVGTQPHQFFLPLDSALPRGAEISSKRTFYKGRGRLATFYSGEGGTVWNGKWFDVKKHYLGLRFTVNGTVHYGWARMNVKVQGYSTVGTLTGYAYETIPDKPIIAGTRGSTSGTGPGVSIEPASLGHLALGAAGKRRGTLAKNK